MNTLTTEHTPEDPENLPPARRRRAHRLLAPLDVDERTAFIDEVARRASPSYDFFLFSFLSGLMIGAGLLMNAPLVLMLGALVAPMMAPIVGLAFGTVIGSIRFFLRSLGGLLVGCLLVVLASGIAGWLARDRLPLELNLALISTQLSWLNFLVLAISSILTTGFTVHSERNAVLPSAALAYTLYIPLACAGFGLGSGAPYLWPDGLVVFALHLAWSVLLGALTLAIIGFRPLTPFGYTLGAAVALLGVTMVIGLTSAGAVFGARIGLPTSTPTVTPTRTPTPTRTFTPVPPTATLTPTSTVTPSLTPTPTFTSTPTPVLAVVRANSSDGVRVRSEPGGAMIDFLASNTLVILLPETMEVDGVIWVRVITLDGLEGWIVQELLRNVTATPAP